MAPERSPTKAPPAPPAMAPKPLALAQPRSGSAFMGRFPVKECHKPTPYHDKPTVLMDI